MEGVVWNDRTPPSRTAREIMREFVITKTRERSMVPDDFVCVDVSLSRVVEMSVCSDASDCADCTKY